MRATAAVIGVLVLCLSAGVHPAKGGRNLVANPGFEAGVEGWRWVTSAAANYQVDEGVRLAGQRSLKVASGSGFQPNVYCFIAQTVGGLKGNTAYRVGVWCKGRRTGIAWVGGGPGWGYRLRLPEGTYDWRRVEGLYVTGAGEASFELMVAVESKSEGVWLDEFSIVEDAEKTAELAAARAREKRETQEKLARLPGEVQGQLERVKGLVKDRPDVARDPYVDLGLAVAERFVARATSGKAKQSAEFSVLQLEEVGQVLGETEGVIRETLAGRRAVVGPVVAPAATRPVVREGALFSGDRPVYLAGYGHFGQIEKDLPNFRRLGVSLVQDGRVGPSAMNEDGSLAENARQTLATVSSARSHGVWVDFLASPHYFPKWALERAKDLPNGNPHWLNFQIDHPVSRQVVEAWLGKMSGALRDSPGLLSLCLTNEPAYEQAGREPLSRPMYEAYLKRAYGSVAKLNDAYQSGYEEFSKVAEPPKDFPAELGRQRQFYDWLVFAQRHWADYHVWMRDVVRRHAPDVPTHAKVMVHLTMNRDTLKYSVDPELFCRATDLAGCDPHAFAGRENDAYAWDWIGQAFWYDLLHSFRGQPVFNSENHLIPDATGPVHVPPGQTYSALWQGALHHQSATTIWVWEEETHPTLAGSIYFRPANVHAAGRAMLDMNRLAPELHALASRPARVGLLYSMPSIVWEPGYKGTIQSAYTAIVFAGVPVTFVSERQLAEGAVPNVEYLVVPAATHVTDATVAALAARAAAGMEVVRMGEGCLSFDEYHRPRGLPTVLAESPLVAAVDDGQLQARLLRAELARLGLKSGQVLTAGTATPAWGVEWHTAEQGGRTLVALINHLPTRQAVHLQWAPPGQATDLLAGTVADLHNLPLPPMRPVLLSMPAGVGAR